MKNRHLTKVLGFSSFITLGLLAACQMNTPSKTLQPVAVPDNWPVVTSKVSKDLNVEFAIDDIIEKMSLKEKIAQMIQPEIRSFTVEDMRKYGFGSYLNGGGSFPNENKFSTPDDWVALADKLYLASIDDSLDGNTIPTMWGTDAVHGHNNVVGATYFPHNIGLGAANNPDLIREIGSVTARAVRETGIDWVFAPTVAVARDDRWGRAYESYSEDPEIVQQYSGELVIGLQGESGKDFMGEGKVIATAKHFLGDGGTVKGDDQGENSDTEQVLIDMHLPGYISSLEEGVQTVMASFNSWHGKKMHGNKSMLTDVLKGRMGFDGLVVGDWNGHGQVSGCSNASCAQAINAGIDIVMVPNDWKALFENTIKQVEDGVISESRINDAVRRILRVKFRAGLFEGLSPSEKSFKQDKRLGSSSHRALARRAVRESLVLLKNKNGILPLLPNQKILVAGDGANNIGKQSGGWSVTWQGTGTQNSDFPGATSIWQGIASHVKESGGQVELSVEGNYTTKPDVAIVVFGENPYAEGEGDQKNIRFNKGKGDSLKILKKLKLEGIPVVSVFITGRPLWVNREINTSNAFVVAWLPGTEGGGIADLLFRDKDNQMRYDFTGRLSFSWPDNETQMVINRGDGLSTIFKYGFGLSYKDQDTLGDNLDESMIDIAAPSINDPLDIFNRRPAEGAGLYIGDPANWGIQVTTSVARTQGSDNLVVRAVNWKVQEDSRQLVWSGKAPAIGYLAYKEPKDFEGYVSSGSAMVFSMKVDSAPTQNFDVKVDCGYPCGGSIPIKKLIDQRELGEWSEYSIDMRCFENAGADLSIVHSPFLLFSDGAADVSFSDIKIEPKRGSSADMVCQ